MICLRGRGSRPPAARFRMQANQGEHNRAGAKQASVVERTVPARFGADCRCTAPGFEFWGSVPKNNILQSRPETAGARPPAGRPGRKSTAGTRAACGPAARPAGLQSAGCECGPQVIAANAAIHSAIIRCYPLLSAVIRYYPLLSAGIRWYPLVSAVIRCYPLLSAVIRDDRIAAADKHCTDSKGPWKRLQICLLHKERRGVWQKSARSEMRSMLNANHRMLLFWYLSVYHSRASTTCSQFQYINEFQ